MKSPNILLSLVAAVTMTFGVSTSSVHAQCASDITGDGQINGADLSQLLADWGSCLAGVITSVTPLQGSVLGGTQITINGTNLAGTTAVKIGGVDCTNLQVLSPTVVKAVTPAGAAGEASIAIVSAAGSTLVPTPFSYVLQSITSVSPNIGIYSGGTAITITGTFLSGATSVKVGGVPATDVVAVNSTTVTAVTPAGSVGAASVEVTGAKGTATASGAFTYRLDPIVPTWATLLEAAPDPTVVTEAKRFAAIGASGFAWRIRDNSSNIEMLLVPAGQFTMGCSPGDAECGADEIPAHVAFTNAFYMGKTEVTQAQWEAKMGNNPSYFYGATNNPVEQVSWNMIQGFNSATGLRLPTEAEWETACRAGTKGATDGDLDSIAWYHDNVIIYGTQPVAGKLPNAIGLYDTLGNVFEWCQDWYGSTYYASSPFTNPTGPTTGSYRLWRGGNWLSQSNACRASKRDYGTPDDSNLNLGFRAVRNP